MVIDTRKCQKRRTAAPPASRPATWPTTCRRFPRPSHEVKWIWKEDYPKAFPNQVHPYTEDSLLERQVLVLCNHCDRPPCVRVCPTQATFKNATTASSPWTCTAASAAATAWPPAPTARAASTGRTRGRTSTRSSEDYPTRTKGVVEKCNFCAERLAKGKLPACVEACAPGRCGALIFGDLNDPESEVSQLLRTTNTIRRKPSLGTAPSIFYIV